MGGKAQKLDSCVPLTSCVTPGKSCSLGLWFLPKAKGAAVHAGEGSFSLMFSGISWKTLLPLCLPCIGDMGVIHLGPGWA